LKIGDESCSGPGREKRDLLKLLKGENWRKEAEG
jgi:hypothetical protein